MRILICPLNWGLGHASRCVPLIKKLIAEGHHLTLVADGYPLEFLRQAFPTLPMRVYPSYRVKYSAGNSQIFAMMCNLPKIIAGIVKEHAWLDKLIKTENYDQVISDNRFGMWNKKLHSIYITHQLMIKMPGKLKFLEWICWYIHRKIINRYNECWIVDRASGEGISGDLAHKYPLPGNAKFIGLLSRFQDISGLTPNKEYSQVAVLSGIEPQRTIFEKQLIEKFRKAKFKTLIIQGLPQAEKQFTQIENLSIVSHLSDQELAEVLTGTEKITARSGYSLLMDLHALQCLDKAELIATPGQTEQEYLATIYKSQIREKR